MFRKHGAAKTIAVVVALLGAFALSYLMTAPSVHADPILHTTSQARTGATSGPAVPTGEPAIRLTKVDGSAITRADVTKYVEGRGMPRTVGTPRPFVITRAEMLSSGTINGMLRGDTVGVPESQMLWFVELRGTFVFPGPDGVTVTSHIGYHVFDAVTGNLLMFGGLG